jgi:hypothetical protein
MKKELEEKLFNDFPLLYHPDRNIRESLMCFGFECGDGWYDLIRELSEKLYPLIEKIKPDEYGTCCSASQVKEKYGTLRFYMHTETDEMSDLIREYEDRSSRICEACGKPGNLQERNRWYSTTCEEHRPK